MVHLVWCFAIDMNGIFVECYNCLNLHFVIWIVEIPLSFLIQCTILLSVHRLGVKWDPECQLQHSVKNPGLNKVCIFRFCSKLACTYLVESSFGLLFKFMFLLELVLYGEYLAKWLYMSLWNHCIYVFKCWK